MIGNVYIDKKRYLYSAKIKLDTVGSDDTSRIDLLCGSVEFSDLQIRSRFYLYLDFPGKLKCEYFDSKRKEIIINNKKMAITQKRYNKTYHYPMSKSPFLNILYKDKLLEIVKTGDLELTDNIIKLIYLGENRITIFLIEKI